MGIVLETIDKTKMGHLVGQSVEYGTLDLRVVISSPTLGVEIT